MQLHGKCLYMPCWAEGKLRVRVPRSAHPAGRHRALLGLMGPGWRYYIRTGLRCRNGTPAADVCRVWLPCKLAPLHFTLSEEIFQSTGKGADVPHFGTGKVGDGQYFGT